MIIVIDELSHTSSNYRSQTAFPVNRKRGENTLHHNKARDFLGRGLPFWLFCWYLYNTTDGSTDQGIINRHMYEYIIAIHLQCCVHYYLG